jgi:hypothetical protein
MGILVDSLKRIREDDCTNFINETLAKYRVAKGVNSLDKLLNRARFGFYDNSWSGPDYGPQDLGLDSHGALRVRAAFLRVGVAAVTAPDLVHVFLSAAVFERSSSILPIESWNHNADTPGYIVHELFHVAGIDENIVDSQAMTNSISEHCHLVGTDRIRLVPH